MHCPFCCQEIGNSEDAQCGLRNAVLDEKMGNILWIHDITINSRQYQPQWFVREDGIYKFRLYSLENNGGNRLEFELTDGVDNITPLNIYDKLSLLLSFQ